jgi:hypothetical protein
MLKNARFFPNQYLICRNFSFDLSIFICSLFAFLLFSVNPINAYSPPTGIPDPGYWGGTHPIDSNAPTTCSDSYEWNHGQTRATCYYVNNNDTNCSDSTNGNPSSPRCSIPTILDAGDYVEIHGGPYTVSSPTQGIIINAFGAQGNPVWIRGPGNNSKAEIQMLITVKGQYVIIENLYWNNKADNLTNLLRFEGDVSYACIRNSKFEGSGNNLGHGLQAINIYSQQGYSANNIVIYYNEIYNLGKKDATSEND